MKFRFYTNKIVLKGSDLFFLNNFFLKITKTKHYYLKNMKNNFISEYFLSVCIIFTQT